MNEVDSIRLKQCHQLKKHMPFFLDAQGGFLYCSSHKKQDLITQASEIFFAKSR